MAQVHTREVNDAAFLWVVHDVAPRAMAKKMVQLMAGLDYEHYLAQGGDWGAMVTRHMADLDPEHCEAIHLNMVLAFPPEGVEDPLSLLI